MTDVRTIEWRGYVVESEPAGDLFAWRVRRVGAPAAERSVVCGVRATGFGAAHAGMRAAERLAGAGPRVRALFGD